MTTSSIPATLNDILVKLKILSKIERGQKINMAKLSFTDSSSLLGSLERSLAGEGRKSLIIHLNQIIQNTIVAIGEYQSEEFKILVLNHLAQAKLGIQNLISTYQKDPCVVSQLEVCIANIDIQLERNKNYLDGWKEEVKPLN